MVNMDKNIGSLYAQELKEICNSPLKTEFKPFDKVLVRDNEKQVWLPRLFDLHVEQADFWTQDGKSWKMCIPYEGNEHLVNTTNKPKEE